MKNTNKKLLIALLLAGLYVVQFLVLPLLLPYYFRESNEATAMYWVTTILVTVLGALFVSNRLRDWHIGNVMYLILPLIYSSNGAYGTGYGSYYHLHSALIELMITAVRLYVLQLIVIGFIKLSNKIRQ